MRQQQTPPSPGRGLRTGARVSFCGGDRLNLYCNEIFEKRCFSVTAHRVAPHYQRKPGRREDEINQTLRCGLTPLNHQIRIASTTTTNKIVSFICALRRNYLLLSEANCQAPFVPLLFPMQPPIALGCSALPWPLQRQCQQP